MERLLLGVLVLLGVLDAVDAARTQGQSFQARMTRAPHLCPETKEHEPQSQDGPAGQGTPCPSLIAGSLTTRLDPPRWPTDAPKENPADFWAKVVVDFLVIMCALSTSLVCCCYLSQCWRNPHPDPERFRLQTISPSRKGQREYNAITEGALPSAAEGRDSPPMNDEDEDYDDDDEKAPFLWSIDNRGEAVLSDRLKGKTEPKSGSDTVV